MKKTPRKGTLIAAWAVAVAVGGLAGILPATRSLKALDAEAEALEDRIARADDGEAELRRLAEQLAALAERAKRETTPIPEESDVASLIRQLSERLDAMGVSDREITTGGATLLDDASAMPMSVTAQGKFLSVYEAVRWVESLPRLVRVQRLRIDTERVRDLGPGHVRAELLLDIFFGPRTPEPAADAKAGGARTGGRK